MKRIIGFITAMLLCVVLAFCQEARVVITNETGEFTLDTGVKGSVTMDSTPLAGAVVIVPHREPAQIAPFRLGEERTVPITGQVLLPDGSPAGRTWMTASHVNGWRNLQERLLGDEEGRFTTRSHPGGYFMVMVDSPFAGNDRIAGLASSIVAHIITGPPIPGQYDIQMVEGTKVYGKLTYPDGSVAAGKNVSVTA